MVKRAPREPMVSGSVSTPNGAAWAAFLGASIGAFAMGLIVVLNEAGIFAAPTIYGPAGGVSGRTTLAIAVWLVAWGVLHARWKDTELTGGTIASVALVLTILGILGTFPPVWTLLP
jgi:hypothetical protein